ncbi:hypothetical protein KJ359_011367 [Pestalotiopsis sp. 9143b]|nr:hypothetical protein KJ359_011367 [Pestalotiopsis sp. 9143b]
MGNAKEAGHILDGAEDASAPPPAYSEAVPPSSSSHQDQEAPQEKASSDLKSIRPTAHIPQQFPPSFNAYYQWKFTKTFHLGEHKDRPLYAVRTHTGWSSAPGVVLHNGPSDKDPVLAAAGNESTWSKHTVVVLPPLPGSGAESSTEFMRTNLGWKTQTYPFTIEVGDTSGGAGRGAWRRENFEWRQSHGGEVRQLGKCFRGWKLVRLGADADGPGGQRDERAAGASSDGKEVVAVWAFYSGWSMTKSFKFQFLGSGLTGELGERWSVMAVITALRMWYLHFQGVNASTAATAGAC